MAKTQVSAAHTLRRSTRHQHARLNRHPLLAQLLSPQLTLSSYHHLLKRYAPFYQACDQRFLQGIKVFNLDLDFTPRLKTGWLSQDLAFFNDSSPILPPELPPLLSAPQLIGEIYVLEGSTLGGQLISRHLEAQLALTASSGARFFNGYTHLTDAYWKDFSQFLERHLSHEADLVEACGAANQLFKLFAKYLDHDQSRCPA